MLLEFPLNHVTFINIGKEVKTIATKGFAKPAPAQGSASKRATAKAG